MSDRPEVGLDRRASNPEERIQRLAQEKSFLQLVIDLTNRMIAVPGLEALADCILQGLAGVIGGTDLSLWYRVDGRYRCHALLGAPRTLDAPDDELVAAVFAHGRPLDFESRFDETRMTTAAFGAARTWVQPLAVGDEVVGVVRLDNLHSGLADASSAMRTLFAYVAMALNNAVTSRDRLREANGRLADEVARRRRAEDELRASHDLLEQRVVERTHDPRAGQRRPRCEPRGVPVHPRHHDRRVLATGLQGSDRGGERGLRTIVGLHGRRGDRASRQRLRGDSISRGY
jgi:transcriptional regulator with GAF, ATPase, and Fis domain